MTVGYYSSHQQIQPEYRCQRDGIEHAQAPCQRVLGGALDHAIGELLVKAMTPLALEVALTVQDELTARADEVDRLRRQQVERARYEAEMAQRRFLRVNPDNRLVADSLEAEWNHKLRALAAAQEEYERERTSEAAALSEKQRAEVLALATDFPRLWNDPATPNRERKRMVRLLIEDVTLLRADQLLAQIRFRGGTTRTLGLPLPRPSWQLRRMDPNLVAEINRLLDDHTDAQVVDILNSRGLQPAVGARFSPWIIWKVRSRFGLEDHGSRVRRRHGLLTLEEMAAVLDVHPGTVQSRCARGQLDSVVIDGRGRRLYRPPAEPRLVPCSRCGRLILERGTRGQLRKWCSVTSRTAAYASRRAAAGWVRVRRR